MATKEQIVFTHSGLEPNRKMFLVNALIDGSQVGYISVRKSDVVPTRTPVMPRSACYQVAGIEIDPPWRRQGIGTALYEEAARIAAEAGYALCSDTVRSDETERFWEKQRRKGRAGWEVPGPPEYEEDAIDYGRYVLKYPPPGSLSGMHGKELNMAELTEKQAERYITKRLKEEGWHSNAIDHTLDALRQLDGFWSYGTVRMIKDLEQIYGELVADHGEPPDNTW